MKSPKNTAQESANNPASVLLAALTFGASGSIERQEAQGQRSFVESETLPTEIDAKSKAALIKAGVVFVGPVKGDDLFQYVTLPVGWKKESTEHSMWSNLVDDKGRVRASVFYKAAFYDRHAHANCCRRFSSGLDYGLLKSDLIQAHVKDGEKIIFSTEPVGYNGMPRDDIFAAQDAARDAAKGWLIKNYPDYEDTSAYWD